MALKARQIHIALNVKKKMTQANRSISHLTVMCHSLDKDPHTHHFM